MKTFEEYLTEAYGDGSDSFYGSKQTEKETNAVIHAYVDHFRKLGWKEKIRKPAGNIEYDFVDKLGNKVILSTMDARKLSDGTPTFLTFNSVATDTKEKRFPVEVVKWMADRRGEYRTAKGHTNACKEAINYLKTIN